MTPKTDSVAVLRAMRSVFDTIPPPCAERDALDAAIAALEAQASAPEHPEAAEVCAMAYQVVGSLLSDVGAFDTELGEKILDCLSEHRMVHPVDEILPWPSFQQASAPGGEVTEALKPTPMVPNGFGGQEPAFRMDAYYYGFAATGIEVIDLILSAVACAGKAFHHTEQWNEKGEQRHRMRGETPVEWIQNAANDAADAIRAALAARTDKGEADDR